MALLKKRKVSSTPEATDDIPEKIAGRLHLIYFTVKWMVIGLLLFFICGAFHTIAGMIYGVDDLGALAEDTGVLCHQYCGTFFVEMNQDNSMESPEAYSEYNKRNDSSESEAQSVLSMTVRVTGGVLLLLLIILHLSGKKPRILRNRYGMMGTVFLSFLMITYSFMGGMTLLLFLLMFLALRSGEKRTIFRDRASDYFIMFGLTWLTGNTINEIIVYLSMAEQGKGLTGIFSHPVYYMMLYNIAAIPVIVICGGLMLRRHELDLRNADTRINSCLLKFAGYCTAAGGMAFTLWRIGVRSYELIRVMSGDAYTVKLAFTIMDSPYNKLIDLPYEMAKSPQAYQDTVLFRYIKDIPVGLLAAGALILFTAVVLRISRGELNTSGNRKFITIAVIMLIAASVWFNLMGIKELDFFNNGFTGIYGKVTYTLALRSLTEPAIYAVVLWFFKTYLQAVPEKASPEQGEESTASDG